MGQSEKYFGSSLVFRFLFRRSLFWIVFSFVPCFFLPRTTSRRALGLAYCRYIYITYVCTRYLPAAQRQVGRDGRARAIGREKYGPDQRYRRTRCDGANVSACCCLLLICWCCCSWYCIGHGDVVIVDVAVVVVHVVVVDVVPVAVIVVAVVVRLFWFHMADIFLLTKRVVFVSFLFDFFIGGALPFMILYEFRLNRLDPSIVNDRPCALLLFRERKKDRVRSRRSTSAVFLFFSGR